MNLTTLSINIFALSCFFVAFIKDKQKTKQAVKIAVKTFIKILHTILLIVVLVGLLLGLVPALTGAILYIPSIVAFPLAPSFIKAGATITTVAVFITTLTMIGFVTLPLEYGGASISRHPVYGATS